MTKFKMFNWDESIIKVGKRNCPECNAEMKYIGIEFEGEPNAHFWECPVDNIEHGYVEVLTEKDIALIEDFHSKQPKRPYHVRMVVDAEVQARTEKEAVQSFGKPYQDFLTQLFQDESFRYVEICLPNGSGEYGPIYLGRALQMKKVSTRGRRK
jgi:hypothetical protein